MNDVPVVILLIGSRLCADHISFDNYMATRTASNREHAASNARAPFTVERR